VANIEIECHKVQKFLPTFVAMKLALISILTFILNLPFGYWRTNVRKFSLEWVLAIHIPVILVILERVFSGLGFALITYPVLIGSFFLGQFIGGKFHHWMGSRGNCVSSSCMVMDFYRCLCRTGH
jgi:hypothetical protein